MATQVWNKSKGVYEDEMPIVDNSSFAWNKSLGIYGNVTPIDIQKNNIKFPTTIKPNNEVITNSLWKVPSYNYLSPITKPTPKNAFPKKVLPETKEAVVDVPPIEPKGLSTIGAANIATGISTAANVATSIYGAIQASKMKPVLASYQAPVEPILVNDNTSAILSAGKENIDKSVNTARSLNQRNGIVGMDSILLSKENEGLNQLSGQLAQYRTGIDNANAQIQNQNNQYNSNMVAQKDQFNAQTQNQFDQYKGQLIGMGMKNATDSLQSGTESIFGNIMAGSQMQLSSINSEISTIMEQLKQPDAIIKNPNLQKRLNELQLQKDNLNNSIFGQTQLKA